jgi:hypothetical protein
MWAKSLHSLHAARMITATRSTNRFQRGRETPSERGRGPKECIYLPISNGFGKGIDRIPSCSWLLRAHGSLEVCIGCTRLWRGRRAQLASGLILAGVWTGPPTVHRRSLHRNHICVKATGKMQDSPSHFEQSEQKPFRKMLARCILVSCISQPFSVGFSASFKRHFSRSFCHFNTAGRSWVNSQILVPQ